MSHAIWRDTVRRRWPPSDRSPRREQEDPAAPAALIRRWHALCAGVSRSLSWTVAIAGSITILVACFALYAPFVRDFFVLDDFIWLHAARTPDTAAFFRDAMGFPEATPYSVPTPFWRPLIDTYFFVAWRLFGLNPLPYHLSGVAIHAANAILLMVLVRQVSGSRIVALLTGLLWAILPVYDYAVVWISEATELVATFWYLLTLVLFVSFLRSGRGRWWLYFGALGCMSLALLAKQSSITIPAVLAMLALVLTPPRGIRDILRSSRSLAPFVLVVLAYGIFLFQHDYRTSAASGMYQVGPHALANGWDYLLRLTWPFVTPGYHVESMASATAAAVFVAAGCAALVLRRPRLGVAFLWVVIALLPYSFFPAGTESRYLYLAAAPFTLFVVLAVQQALALVRPAPWRIVAGGAVLLAVPLLCMLLAREARERQAWIHQQSLAYQQVFTEVPDLCGAVPDGGRIAVVGGPMLDLFGDSTRMALNLRYPRVQVERLYQPEAALRSASCAVHFVEGEYERLPAEQVVIHDR